jgi:LPXTG-motif cell wall-anchored protein
MKLIKKVSAAVVSAALAATMAFSASAETTVDDVIQAAIDNGVQAHNVKQLEQFIFENAEEFDDAERAEMVKAIQNSGLIVAKYTDKDLAELTEEERNTILKGMSDEDKQTILDNMVAMGAAVDVEITYEKSDTNFGYDVFATMKKTADGDGDSKGGDSKGGTTKIDTLPNTGDVNNVNTVAVVMASMAIILAGAGIVVVAKKNKEN